MRPGPAGRLGKRTSSGRVGDRDRRSPALAPSPRGTATSSRARRPSRARSRAPIRQRGPVAAGPGRGWRGHSSTTRTADVVDLGQLQQTAEPTISTGMSRRTARRTAARCRRRPVQHGDLPGRGIPPAAPPRPGRRSSPTSSGLGQRSNPVRSRPCPRDARRRAAAARRRSAPPAAAPARPFATSRIVSPLRRFTRRLNRVAGAGAASGQLPVANWRSPRGWPPPPRASRRWPGTGRRPRSPGGQPPKQPAQHRRLRGRGVLVLVQQHHPEGARSRRTDRGTSSASRAAIAIWSANSTSVRAAAFTAW